MQKLLLLHGALGSKAQLEPLKTALAAHYDVYSLNLPGHGGEPFPTTAAFGIPAFAEFVLDWLHEQQIEQVSIFGYSMGGYVGLYLARHHPEKVKQVFSLAAKLNWTPAGAEHEVKMLDAEKIEAKVPAFAQQLQERHAPLNWKEVLQKTAFMMRQLGEINALQPEDFPKIGQAVQLAVGDRDNMVTLDETWQAYKLLPQAQLLVLPQTPHPLEKVNLERLTQECRWFFR